jgi:hypothetical protein
MVSSSNEGLPLEYLRSLYLDMTFGSTCIHHVSARAREIGSHQFKLRLRALASYLGIKVQY